MDAADYIPSYDQRAYSQVGSTNKQTKHRPLDFQKPFPAFTYMKSI